MRTFSNFWAYLHPIARYREVSERCCVMQVSGYVIIAFVRASDIIPLQNLRVIRGLSLFHENDDTSTRGYSLYVANNYLRDSPGDGLKELQLTALHGEAVMYVCRSCGLITVDNCLLTVFDVGF